MKPTKVLISGTIALFPILIFSACASLSGASPAGGSAGVPGGATAGTDGVDKAKPLTFPGTVSTVRAGGREYLMADTAPRSGVPVFFSVSPRLSDREDEIAFCLVAAAEQASRFMAVEAEVQVYHEKDSASAGYVREMNVRFDRELAESLRDDLVLIDSVQDAEGTYALFSLPNASLSISWAAEGGISREPRWITQPPEIAGYLTGVGSSPRRRLFSDSVTGADEKALEELIKQISLQIRAGTLTYEALGMGSYDKATGMEYSRGIVAGFYIISRFVSRDGQTFYSLAACPVK